MRELERAYLRNGLRNGEVCKTPLDLFVPYVSVVGLVSNHVSAAISELIGQFMKDCLMKLHLQYIAVQSNLDVRMNVVVDLVTSCY